MEVEQDGFQKIYWMHSDCVHHVEKIKSTAPKYTSGRRITIKYSTQS